MNRLIRMPRLAGVTAAVLFLLVLSSGTASAQLDVPVDIKPGSCPNPINVKSHGVLPVAILGTVDFDVNDVDVASLRLEDMALGIEVAAIRSGFEDVATPFEPFLGKTMASDCNELGPDTFIDLTLKFSTDEVVGAFSSLNDGVLVMSLTGVLLDGTAIIGEDVILVLNRGNGGRSAVAPGRIEEPGRSALAPGRNK